MDRNNFIEPEYAITNMWYTQNASCYQAIYPTPKTSIIPVDSNVTCNGPGEVKSDNSYESYFSKSTRYGLKETM